MVETKKCFGCEADKPLDKDHWYFYKSSKKPMGICIVCTIARTEERSKDINLNNRKRSFVTLEGTKFCLKCKTTHDMSDFYVRKSGKNLGKPYTYCRFCLRASSKIYKQQNHVPSTKPKNPLGPQEDWKVKYCKKCDTEHSTSDFYWNKTLSIWSTYCKKCFVTINKERNIKHADKYQTIRDGKKDERRTYSRKYYAANADKKYEQVIAYNELRRDEINAKTAQWRVDHPEEYKAILALNRAVRSGKLTRPTTCELCGKTPQVRKKSPVQGHHMAYDLPLDVLWLCVSDHKRFHAGDPEVVDGCNALWDKKLKDILHKKN